MEFHLLKNMGVMTNEQASHSFRPQVHLLGNLKVSLLPVFKPRSILVWPSSIRTKSPQRKLKRGKQGRCCTARPKPRLNKSNQLCHNTREVRILQDRTHW